jgi:hypothetical protein
MAWGDHFDAAAPGIISGVVVTVFGFVWRLVRKINTNESKVRALEVALEARDKRRDEDRAQDRRFQEEIKGDIRALTNHVIGSAARD